MKKFFSVLSSVLSTLLIVVEVGLIIFVAFFRTGSEPSLFGYRLYVVQTPSMDPDIKVGDLILCKNYKGQELTPYQDIVTYRAQGETAVALNVPAGVAITHQVIEVGDNGTITTKGTNKLVTRSETVKLTDVESTYVCTLHVVGWLYKAVKNPVGFCLIVIVPLGAFIVYEVIQLAKASVKRDEEKENENK